MNKGNWVAIDKSAVTELPKKRPYTGLEAVFCLSVDINNAIGKYTNAGKGLLEIPQTPDEAIQLVMAHGQTISGYAALWGWSRCKVRSFINRLKCPVVSHQTGVRHLLDTLKTETRHPIRLIINTLQNTLDSNETPVRHLLDTTTNLINLKNKKEKKVHSTHTFKPPTIQEVISYCKERKNSVDAQRWVDHYEAVGWLVGKNRMKDWRAAVRTWENSEFGGKNGNGNGNHSKRSTQQISRASGYGDGADYPCDVEVTE
jgi:hypothetical protein